MLRRLVEEKVAPRVTHARTNTIRYRLHVGSGEGKSSELESPFSVSTVSRVSEELLIVVALADLGRLATRAG